MFRVQSPGLKSGPDEIQNLTKTFLSKDASVVIRNVHKDQISFFFSEMSKIVGVRVRVRVRNRVFFTYDSGGG